MSKILLIVEGAKDEGKMLESLFGAFAMHGDIDVVPIEHNISMIFDVINNPKNNYLDEPVDFKQVFSDMLLAEGREDDYKLLQQKIPYTYLVFDLDCQHPSFEFSNVRRMLEFFNDETENGKLLINYPQFESFRDYSLPVPDPSFINRLYEYSPEKNYYKQLVNERGTMINYSRMDVSMFSGIITQNMCKAQKLSTGRCVMPSYAEFLNYMNDDSIINAQEQSFNEECKIWVLCSSLFVIPLYFGKAIFESIVNLFRDFQVTQ